LLEEAGFGGATGLSPDADAVADTTGRGRVGILD
jgi:hypothetical protein